MGGAGSSPGLSNPLTKSDLSRTFHAFWAISFYAFISMSLILLNHLLPLTKMNHLLPSSFHGINSLSL
jgi:hypothetical protein